MTTTKIKAGDTFESISRREYGTEIEAGAIARANPGLQEPLAAGTTLNIPNNPQAPKDAPQLAPVTDEDEVTILIDGQRFTFWTGASLTLSMDSPAAVEFSAPFEPEDVEFRKVFRPFSYQPLEINIGANRAFTGTLIDVNPQTTPKARTVTVSAYSLPGVLHDCTPPASAFPLEFNGQGVREIAKALAAYFGVGVDFIGEQGPVFERVACNPGRKVLDFLSELTRQRNLVTSSNAEGQLLIWKSVKTGNPVARLAEGSAPVLGVTPTFNPQDYFSHITGIEPVTLDADAGSQFTVKNPLLEGVTRPQTFTAQDTESGGLKATVGAKTGRMFGNMVSYDVPVATWRDPQGELWTPNTTLTLVAPGAMVYQEYEFIIRSVTFSADRDSKTAILTLVLPGAFSGELPEALPWDE